MYYAVIDIDRHMMLYSGPRWAKARRELKTGTMFARSEVSVDRAERLVKETAHELCDRGYSNRRNVYDYY